MYTAAALAAHPTASQAVPLVHRTQAAALQTSNHLLSVDVYQAALAAHPAAGQAAPLVRWTQATAFSPAIIISHLLRQHSSLICYGHTAASSATATQQPHLLRPHSSINCYSHTAASSATATQQPHLLRQQSNLTWNPAAEPDSLAHLGPFN
jgi:hypothetical protein